MWDDFRMLPPSDTDFVQLLNGSTYIVYCTGNQRYGYAYNAAAMVDASVGVWLQSYFYLEMYFGSLAVCGISTVVPNLSLAVQVAISQTPSSAQAFEDAWRNRVHG